MNLKSLLLQEFNLNFFELVGEEKASEELKKSYTEIKDVFGIASVPDFFLSLASNNSVFDSAWGGYKKILADGVLPQQIKEIIFLCVSLNRRCMYCSSTHLAVCDMIDSITSLEIETMMEDINSITPERVRDVVVLAIKYVEDPASATKEDFARLRSHGITDREISEIITMAGLAYYAVTIAQAMGIEVEKEIEEYLEENNLNSKLKEKIYG
jgi:uncharacterized peroxidase-related enzyme